MKRGYEIHVSVGRKFRFVRRWSAKGAVRHDGHELEKLLDMANGREKVCADSAQLSAENETMLEKRGFKSRIRRKKLRGKPMPRRASGARRSRMHGCVGAFARWKDPMEFSICGVGPARAEGGIAMSNLCYDMRGPIFLERRMAVRRVCQESGNSLP